MVVISKKWRRSLFFSQNVLFSASQRGKAYSTPWNWCLIILPFLMWDVVTWSYFFPSLSVETVENNGSGTSDVCLTTASAEIRIWTGRMYNVRGIAHRIRQTTQVCLQKMLSLVWTNFEDVWDKVIVNSVLLLSENGIDHKNSLQGCVLRSAAW